VQKDVQSDFGSLFEPYDFFSPHAEDHYGDPIWDPKHDKLHGKPKKAEHEEDIHSHVADHEEVHHEDHHDVTHPIEHEVHHDDEHTTVVRYDCDCSDVAAERDAAIVDRDQAASELALYKLAFGDILAEPAHPVYVPDTTNSHTVSYEDQYEYSYYDPESYNDTVHEDIHYEHEPVAQEYYPTDEELSYFDSAEYAPESYYQADAGTYGYFDYVLDSFDGATDFSNHDFNSHHEEAAPINRGANAPRRNHGHGH